METRNWKEYGRNIAKRLEGLIDVKAIASIGCEATSAIYTLPTPSSRKNALDQISRGIKQSFDSFSEKPDVNEKPENAVYRETGKSAKRWRHLIFDHVTLTQDDWDKINPLRIKHRQKLEQESQEIPELKIDEQELQEVSELKIEEQESNMLAEISLVEPLPDTHNSEPVIRTNQSSDINFTVSNLMNVSQLQLNPEIEKMVNDAITLSNISLPEFIQKACEVYAKTLTRKAESIDVDLASVLTAELLNDKKWQTHPGRAPELTKRAVQAIKKYNADIATEPEHYWHITQSAIISLTGSRASAVAKALEQYKDDIKYLENFYHLTAYSNRKPKDINGDVRDIAKEIDLVALVPDGLGV